MSLLAVGEAQARLLALAPDLSIETVPLNEAAGRWATADVVALRTQPAADLSAMDGYAIRFGDLPGPWKVVGESAAGCRFAGAAATGEAVRIFTGAALPHGADTILVQEEARRDGDALHLQGEGPSREGASVRPAGSDFGRGDPLVPAGEQLTPARVALAAIGGHGALRVRRRVRVALASTGDELVAPGDPADADRLPASNGPMIAAMLRALPVDVVDLGIVRDDLPALVEAFRRGAAEADILVTTGGASVGDHDLVRPALEQAGASLDFWRVAMKPGKPLMAGRLGDAAVLGLPGNPVSAFVAAILFLLPLVRHAMGARTAFPATRRAALSATLPATGSRAEYVRGRSDDGGVRPLAGQDSAALRMLADADVLILRPPYAPAIEAGTAVEILDIA